MGPQGKVPRKVDVQKPQCLQRFFTTGGFSFVSLCPTPPGRPVTIAPLHRRVLDATAAANHGVYLGEDHCGRRHAAAQQAVLVLGPPRSGKTTSLIIPNILGAHGAVVATSTKDDVLRATASTRTSVGTCHLFDPTGSLAPSDSAHAVRWSPLQGANTWSGALSTTAALVRTALATSGRSDLSHWTERAQALLAPIFHAAALDGESMRTVLSWVDRRQIIPAQAILTDPTCALARGLLDGIAETDERERSGIWSTASGVLSSFRSEEALRVTDQPNFSIDAFVRSSDTLYLAAPAHLQALAAPMVVGLIDGIVRATYARDTKHAPPLLLALDEVANIAPLPSLPSMVSEGGGQGVITLACLQDLSQARSRWPGQADGFPSLFGTTVVLPGIGDVRTLEALSTLVGDAPMTLASTTRGVAAADPTVRGLLVGPRSQFSKSLSVQFRRRLPPDEIARGRPGWALAFDERQQAGWVPLAPSHLCEPWRTLRSRDRTLLKTLERDTAPFDLSRGGPGSSGFA